MLFLKKTIISRGVLTPSSPSLKIGLVVVKENRKKNYYTQAFPCFHKKSQTYFCLYFTKAFVCIVNFKSLNLHNLISVAAAAAILSNITGLAHVSSYRVLLFTMQHKSCIQCSDNVTENIINVNSIYCNKSALLPS